ncbi:hypothetical protein [Streptomyces lunaelactis]|nr:hypothetical protein [Streptomyces lunaelactis]
MNKPIRRHQHPSFLSAGNTAAAMLAGLTGAAVSAPVLHRMIGR